MATPPNSSGIFLSSSPTRYSSGPLEEVEVFVAQARMVDRLDPCIEAFLTTNRSHFFLTFARRLDLIKSRSQAFEDCHVTVFDKVLLELTQNGDNLENPPAIHYFCEEFLAIPAIVSRSQKTAILSSELAASLPVLPAVTPPDTHQGSFSASDASTEPVDSKPKLENEPHPQLVLLTPLTKAIGPAMERMWTVYGQAKREFFANANPDDTKHQHAAKFLRDTAENALQYLQDKDPDRRLLGELETTLRVAEEAVMAHHGGKKRKFDHLAPSETVEWTSPQQKTKSHRPDVERGILKYDHRPGVSEEYVRGDFAGHARAFTQHQRSGPFRAYAHTRRNAVTELFPEERVPKRKKKNQNPRTQPGRGHSHIPFGYSRPVDSYQPRT